MIAFMIMCICSSVFIGIGIYAMKKEKAMWFYSGSEEEIEQETFHDVKEYNRKNGIMWIVFGIATLLPPLAKSLFHISNILFFVFYMGILVFGMIAMMLYWNHLHDKYTS